MKLVDFYHLNCRKIVGRSVYFLSKGGDKNKYTFLHTRVNITEQILCAPLNVPVFLFFL